MSQASQNVTESADRSKIHDLERFLPFGETLRGYLDQSFVKVSDLSDLLRARGVFVQSPQKEDLIPILTATLISPVEFQTLLDCRKERDLKEKVINRTRSWKSKRSLFEAANDAVKLENIPFESTQKCTLLGRPKFSSVDGSPEHIALEFTVLRIKKSNDWSNEECQFKGKVLLKKEEIAGKIVMSITHTSPETKDIAEKYAKLIESSLRESGDIGAASAEDQILYSSFDNTGRADFLLSLTGNCDHNELEFLRLNNLEALTEAKEVIPANCKDLIEGFEQLRLRGELHHSAYCRKREIYPFVRFYRMDARFKFKVTGAEGECTVRYEFSDYGTSENPAAEFTQEVEVANLADKYKALISKSDVKRPLQELVTRVVAEKYRLSRERAAAPREIDGNATEQDLLSKQVVE